MEVLMAKVGRPKAPVSITFTQEQLSMLIEHCKFQCEMQVEEFFAIHSPEHEYKGDPSYYLDTSEVFLLTGKLKNAYEKKYGAKDAG
jgi:hypothetical protein